MDEYCRFCAEKNEVLFNIFEKGLSLYDWFAEIINQGLHIDIKEDCLPKNICSSCLRTIEDLNYFVIKSRVSLLRLKEIWKNNTVSSGNKLNSDCVDKDEISEPELDTEISVKDDSKYKEINNSTTRVIDSNKKILCSQYKYNCEKCSKILIAFDDLKTLKKSPKVSNLCARCGNQDRLRKIACNVNVTNKTAGSEIFKCLYCGKKCKSEYGLEVHTRFHTDYNYKCKICFKIFPAKTYLTRHLVTHTGTGKYVCKEPLCGKSYASSSGLRKHNDVEHTPEHKKNLSCQYCSKKFSVKFMLTDHIKRLHNDVYLEQIL